jgi:hypothetical protein
MTPTTDAPAARRLISVPRGRDRIARSLLWLAAVGAAASAAASVSTIAQASGATTVVETWRGYGYLVFAGLFVLLALRPHNYRGVWELVIANKVALTATALAFAARGGIAATGTIIIWDGGLSVLLIAAYLTCRGWSRAPEAAVAP